MVMIKMNNCKSKEDMNRQKKSLYIAPTMQMTYAESEQLMITASPGVDEGGYEEGGPIDGKRRFDDEEWMETQSTSLWDDVKGHQSLW